MKKNLSILAALFVLVSCGNANQSDSISSLSENNASESVESTESTEVVFETFELSNLRAARTTSTQQELVGKHVKVKGKISYVEGDYFYLQDGNDSVVVRYKDTTAGVNLVEKDNSVIVSGCFAEFSAFGKEVILNAYDYNDESLGLIESTADVTINKVTDVTTDTLTCNFASIVSLDNLTVSNVGTKAEKPFVTVENTDKTLVFTLFATSKITGDLLSTLEALQVGDSISFEGVNLSNNTTDNGVVLTLLQGAKVVKK